DVAVGEGHVRDRAVTIVLWALTLLSLGIGVRRTRSALDSPPLAKPTVWPAQPVALVADSDSLANLANRLTASNPFRMARKPSDVAYDPAQSGGAQTSSAHAGPTVPALTIAGIVGGPPWTASVNGVPGRDGSASVRAGDTIAGTRVIAVARASVTLSMADTTWRLTLHAPWP